MNDDFQTDFQRLNVFKLCKSLVKRTKMKRKRLYSRMLNNTSQNMWTHMLAILWSEKKNNKGDWERKKTSDVRKKRCAKKCISAPKFPHQASEISMKTSIWKTHCKPLVDVNDLKSHSSHTLPHTYRHRYVWGCFSYPDVVLCAVEGPMGQKGMYSWPRTYSGASVLLNSPQPCSV